MTVEILPCYGARLFVDKEGSLTMDMQGYRQRVGERASLLWIRGACAISLGTLAWARARRLVILVSRGGQTAIPILSTRFRARCIAAQLEAYHDPEWRARLARAFLLAASLNRAHALRILLGADAEDHVERIFELTAELERTEYDRLMQYEAQIAHTYFEALRTAIPERYGFEARTRMPPRDPVSAALSYYNVRILYPLCSTMLSAAGLNPHIGYLHELRGRREALALDLAEEFRQHLVDIPIIGAFIQGLLHPERDFVRRRDGVFLGARGKRKLTRLIAMHLERRIPWRGASLLECVYQQATLLRDHLLGKADYRPFVDPNILMEYRARHPPDPGDGDTTRGRASPPPSHPP